MSTKNSIECYDLTVMVCLTTIHLVDVDPVHLFLSLSSQTEFRRKPPPIAVSAVAYVNCTNGESQSQSNIQCVKTH